jgi:hypothetical protein
MSGPHRLSRDGFRKPSVPSLRRSALNFGLIAMVLLAALAIIVTVMFPETTSSSGEYPGLASSP